MMNAARNASAVREPTQDELNIFGSLSDIMAWVAVKGKLYLEYTQAAALLYHLAGDEFRTVQAEELASVSLADFEETLTS